LCECAPGGGDERAHARRIFFPRIPGTSVCVNESTPHGLTVAIASATFSAESPPARITGIRERSTTARLTDQS